MNTKQVLDADAEQAYASLQALGDLSAKAVEAHVVLSKRLQALSAEVAAKQVEEADLTRKLQAEREALLAKWTRRRKDEMRPKLERLEKATKKLTLWRQKLAKVKGRLSSAKVTA